MTAVTNRKFANVQSKLVNNKIINNGNFIILFNMALLYASRNNLFDSDVYTSNSEGVFTDDAYVMKTRTFMLHPSWAEMILKLTNIFSP